MSAAMQMKHDEGLERAEQILEGMLEGARVKPALCYLPRQVQAVLAISESTFQRLCDAWEPDGRNPFGLESYRLTAHRRVTHRALARWIARNHSYARENSQ